MADSLRSSSLSTTAITDLDVDSLAQCASYLSLQDISNMAMTCKSLRNVAYSDSVWRRLFREQWPDPTLERCLPRSQVREAFLNRRTALQQFKFVDPLVADIYTDARTFSHVLLDKNCIFFSQGSAIRILKTSGLLSGKDFLMTLNDHKARITCMRLFLQDEACIIRSEMQRNENVLLTSSCDHSIRLWWKGSCLRCFRGHNGPVSTLSDKLLGDRGSKTFASGGEDGTVRLWSLSSSGKRGQQALKATLYVHEKPIKLMSVAGHKTSLLISIAIDSKIRVWDVSASSAARSSCCVGTASVRASTVGMKCHESLLYVAAGSDVQTIDLRTMKKAFTAAICQPELHSLEILPSRSLVCTGSVNSALLWDIRKSQEVLKQQPLAELEGHGGPVSHLHMDPYKIVTGSPRDFYTNIWDVTGAQMNSLLCSDPDPDESNASTGCDAMGVDGCRIVTACSSDQEGLLRFRDFSNASSSVSSCVDEIDSKFWNPVSYSDSD